MLKEYWNDITNTQGYYVNLFSYSNFLQLMNVFFFFLHDITKWKVIVFSFFGGILKGQNETQGCSVHFF